MTATNLAPILLVEPITGLMLRAENFSMSNAGDENITLNFHKILVLPDELVRATEPLFGKGLIVWRNKTTWLTAIDDPISMVQVVQDMKRTGEAYNSDGGKIRLYYVYDYLITKLIRTPMQFAELIETENVKLLEGNRVTRAKT